MGSKISKLKRAIMDTIIEDWTYFKVCEGCEIVVDDDIWVCPVCSAYRFDSTKERIITQAEVVAEEYSKFIGTEME